MSGVTTKRRKASGDWRHRGVHLAVERVEGLVHPGMCGVRKDDVAGRLPDRTGGSECVQGMHLAATREGMFVSPESGAALITTRMLRENGFLAASDEVVVFSTGSGLMHTNLVPQSEMNVVDPADTTGVWERLGPSE